LHDFLLALQAENKRFEEKSLALTKDVYSLATNYQGKLFNPYEKLGKERLLSDVTLKVNETEKYRCHKAILAAGSDVFLVRVSILLHLFELRKCLRLKCKRKMQVKFP
jgi:hypothetical protein